MFGLKLRNCGFADYGLVVHLSDVLQGNIYGFGTQGHQVLYEEIGTYEVAVAWSLGTTTHDNIGEPPSFDAPVKNNPYFLPFILAKLISDARIVSHSALGDDLKELIRLFELWDTGSNRALKDVKYRLEPLRSKL